MSSPKGLQKRTRKTRLTFRRPTERSRHSDLHRPKRNGRWNGSRGTASRKSRPQQARWVWVTCSPRHSLLTRKAAMSTPTQGRPHRPVLTVAARLKRPSGTFLVTVREVPAGRPAWHWLRTPVSRAPLTRGPVSRASDKQTRQNHPRRSPIPCCGYQISPRNREGLRRRGVIGPPPEINAGCGQIEAPIHADWGRVVGGIHHGRGGALVGHGCLRTRQQCLRGDAVGGGAHRAAFR